MFIKVIYLFTVSAMRFWPNVSLYLSFSRCQIKGKADLRSVFSEISPLCVPCVIFQAVSFSITRVHINFTLTLPPICSIHLLAGHLLPLQSNREFTLPFTALWEAQQNYLWLMWFLLLVLMTKLQQNPALLCTTLGKKSAQLLSAKHNKNLINQDSAYAGFGFGVHFFSC